MLSFNIIFPITRPQKEKRKEKIEIFQLTYFKPVWLHAYVLCTVSKEIEKKKKDLIYGVALVLDNK